MMPIVDAQVGLAQHAYNLGQYMDGCGEFHVLRMVAVQPVPALVTSQEQRREHEKKRAAYLETKSGLQAEALQINSGVELNALESYSEALTGVGTGAETRIKARTGTGTGTEKGKEARTETRTETRARKGTETETSARTQIQIQGEAQTKSAADLTWPHLAYLQRQANTRGSGGLPNALIAACDLSNTPSLESLVMCDHFSNLRGVCSSLDGNSQDTGKVESVRLKHIEQSIAVLNQHRLVLDLTLSDNTVALIDILACMRESLPIVVGVSGIQLSWGNDGYEAVLQSLSTVSRHENVHLKLNDGFCAYPDSVDQASGVLDAVLTLFGHERIMFSSGLMANTTNPSFTQIWTSYMKASDNLPARYRDTLFRANAMRVYRM